MPLSSERPAPLAARVALPTISTEPTLPPLDSADASVAAENQAAIEADPSLGMTEAEQPAEVEEPEFPDTQAGTALAEDKPASRDLAAEVWCEPVVLRKHLEGLASAPATSAWAHEVDVQLQQLRTAMGVQSDEAIAIVDRLAELCHQAGQLAKQLGEQPLASELRRARHALARRGEIWRQVLVVGGPRVVAGRRSEPDPAQLDRCLTEVDGLITRLKGAEGWRSYLELDALRAMGDRPTETSPLLAAEVLRRMTRVPMTPVQQRIAASGPMVRLAEQLRYWAGEPVEVRRLLESVERYEENRLATDAHTIAADCVHLTCSPIAEERVLGGLVEEYYRNANLRLVVSVDLVNRLVPDREPAMETVNDRVLGKPVRGKSMTTTEVAFRFIPDATRLRAALEIRGLVAAETSSYSGPAMFFNSSWSNFLASKEIEVGSQGLTLQPAQVQVQNETRLRSVYTDFDVIPLVGSVAQEIARSQAEEKQPEIRRELEWKVSNRVKQQIDEEADARLGKASQRLKDRLFDPLAAMALGPTLVSAETTEQRISMRLRLATPTQLGGHTPRPRAPGNSLASLQIHESALANLIEQLGFDGQTLTVVQLRERIAARLNRPEMLQNQGDHDDVTICFAKENAVQIRYQDGQVAITLQVAWLHEPQTDERWEDFQVQTFYRPRINGRHAEFAREGVIYLDGDGLSMRSQIALRGIFSKTFSKQRPVVLTPDTMLEDPRIAGLSVSQVVIDDGWLSIAFGPEGSAADPMVARLPETDEE
jgi:hypothetical protein